MKTIITYDLMGKSPVQKTRAIRALFGYEDKSNFGKYNYARKGLISDIPTAHHIKSAILVEKVYARQVVLALKKLKVKSNILDLYKS